MVKPKKHLGQHFLKDENICEKIAKSLIFKDTVLEIGPGTGALTKYFTDLSDFFLCEIDEESILFLEKKYPHLKEKIFAVDFLKFDIPKHFPKSISIIGNFPYYISNQIMFRILDFPEQIVEIVGMFQKEVAERICVKSGSKQYGILSILLEVFYEREYLFTVEAEAFFPPPKVQSGVIRLVKREKALISCNEKSFKKIVKLAFNQRRKTIKNALHVLLDENKKEKIANDPLWQKRAEQLTVKDFEIITLFLESF